MRTPQAPPIRSRHQDERDAAAPPILARGRTVLLDEGLFAVTVGALAADAGIRDGIALPAIQVSSPPSDEYDPVELGLGTADRGDWFGPEGGTIVVKAGPGGGVLLVTAYAADLAAIENDLAIDVHQLDAGRTPAVRAAAPLKPAVELRREIVLHIEREGDRRFNTSGWIGHRGEQIRIEAFGIRPLEQLSPADIEYKAFGPNRRETPWVSDAKLCGTRGHGLPLTGFAIRLMPPVSERFSVVYSGSFFASGDAGPVRDGEPCLPATRDDPLEAMLVRLVERA
jgi:hypothetical protein